MSVRICPAPAQRRREAIQRLLPAGSSKAAQNRLGRLLDSRRVDVQHLVIALDGDELRASALAVIAPGRSASLYASTPDDTAGVSLVAEVIEHLSGVLAQSRIDLAQALLDPDDDVCWRTFAAAGFEDLALLQTLELSIPRRCTAPTLPPDVTLRTADDATLMSVLEDTYDQTLDCPKLRGLRRVEDILIGHRAGGTIDPSTWLVVDIDDTPVGCLLMTGAARETADLAYVGLVPRARGRGLGSVLVQTACARARALGASRVRLAVDAANTPAMRVYQHAGFHIRSIRRAVIRSLRPLQVAPSDTQMSTSD